MTIPSILSVITPATLDVLAKLAVSGQGFDANETDRESRAAALASSKKTRNYAFGAYLDWHAPAMFAMGYDPQEADAVIEHLRMPRCGLPDVLPARASQCRWNHEPVTTALGQGWESQSLFTPEQIRSAIAWSNRRWCEVGGSVWSWHEPGMPGPNQLVHHVRIDGPQNVLADQVLPCSVQRDTECRMRLDSAEFARGGLYDRFGYGYFKGVLGHEDGHKWGHEHSQNPDDLMYPMARPEVTDLAEGDAARHRATYGDPKQQWPDEPDDEPTPEPGPDGDGQETYELNGYFTGKFRRVN